MTTSCIHLPHSLRGESREAKVESDFLVPLEQQLLVLPQSNLLPPGCQKRSVMFRTLQLNADPVQEMACEQSNSFRWEQTGISEPPLHRVLLQSHCLQFRFSSAEMKAWQWWSCQQQTPTCTHLLRLQQPSWLWSTHKQLQNWSVKFSVFCRFSLYWDICYLPGYASRNLSFKIVRDYIWQGLMGQHRVCFV